MKTPAVDSAAQPNGHVQSLWVVTGPESSGKTTLATWLARRLEAPLVPEVARAYFLERQTFDYGPTDVRAIAVEQQRAERRAFCTGAPCVIADTDLRVLKLWWAEKFPAMPAQFEPPDDTNDGPASIRRRYLLCYPDLVWEPDPLRENPLDRVRLFKLQLQALEQDDAEFRVIWGDGEIRQRRAWHYVQQGLSGG